MNNSIELEMDVLDTIDSPLLSDMEWGIAGGAAFAAGVLIGMAIMT